MNALAAIPTVVFRSGMTKREVSRAMDREQSFIGSTIAKQRIPSIALMSEIADVCGYDLILRHRETGDELVIDPPKNS